jgi:hypothetical protein
VIVIPNLSATGGRERDLTSAWLTDALARKGTTRCAKARLVSRKRIQLILAQLQMSQAPHLHGCYNPVVKWMWLLPALPVIVIGYWLVARRRSMSSSVEDEIDKANTFGDTIQNLVVARGQCPTGERNTPLMAYWSLVFEFHRGIVCLLSHKFYGAAFALVRPTIEATVRAHIVIMGSAEDVRKLHEDEYRTNLATIGGEIDKAFGTDNLFENFLTNARKALHSYTHAGVLQLGRRFSGTDLVANYSDGEIQEVIRVSTSAAFIVNNLVTKHFGFEEEWKKNTDLYVEWGQHS